MVWWCGGVVVWWCGGVVVCDGCVVEVSWRCGGGVVEYGCAWWRRAGVWMCVVECGVWSVAVVVVVCLTHIIRGHDIDINPRLVFVVLSCGP